MWTTAKINKTHTATAVTTNYRGAVAGSAQWFAWGIKDKRDHGLKSNDLQAVGVQSFPDQQFLQFAISTNHRWSNAAQDVFDVLVDVNNDGTPDYDVEAADHGALTTGVFDGIDIVAVFDLQTGDGAFRYFTDAPTDSSTMILPVDFDQLCAPGEPCLSSTGHFTYSVQALSLTDSTLDTSDGSATFNPNSSGREHRHVRRGRAEHVGDGDADRQSDRAGGLAGARLDGRQPLGAVRRSLRGLEPRPDAADPAEPEGRRPPLGRRLDRTTKGPPPGGPFLFG